MTIPRYELSFSVVTFVLITEYMVYTFHWKTRIWKISVCYYELGRVGSSISRHGCISYCLEKCSDRCLEDPHNPVEQSFQRDHHTMSQKTYVGEISTNRALKNNGFSCNSTNSLLISCQIPCCNNLWALTVEGLPCSSDLQLKSLQNYLM